MLRTPSDPHFGGLDSQVALEATAHGATDMITIPDAHLLFSGDFKRAGHDLILSDDKHKFVVHDYFKFDKHPTLLSPEGAALTADIVAALAGPLMPGHYAQATTPQGQAEAIGRVATVTGNATVIRNGVSIALNVGDAILKGDVVQTASNSALGISFTDGTTFKLDASARMVINDYVYAENGANNSAAISLVQGSIQFLAGAVAHSGDMRVTTPVATMGIRGTAVNVQIDANNGTTNFSVMLEATGRTGSYNLYDNTTGALIGTVSNSAVGWVVSPAGPLQVVAQQVEKPLAQIQQELAIVQQVLSIQAIGQQIIQQAQQQDNTKSTGEHGSSIQIQLNNQNDTQKTITGTVTTTIQTSSDTGSTTGNTNTGTTVTYFEVSNTTTTTKPPPSFIETPTITHVELANLNAIGPVVSANGDVVAFLGTSQLPSNNSDNGSQSVFIYDRLTNTVKSISDPSVIVGTQLHSGETFNALPSVSGDGHYVVFVGQYQQTVTLTDPSNTSNTFTETNSAHETFIYDTQTGITTLLSGNGDNPAISADGHYVAVTSTVYVWTNSGPNTQSFPIEENVINVIDRSTGNTVDQIAIGAPTPSANLAASSSSEVVTFTANSGVFGSADVGSVLRVDGGIADITSYISPTQLVGTWIQNPNVILPNDPNNTPVPAASGNWTLAASNVSWDSGVNDPALSADGQFLTFWSTAAYSLDVTIGTTQEHFAINNPNGNAQVYVLDLNPNDPITANTLQLVSAAANGAAGTGNSGELFVSNNNGPSVTTPENTPYTFTTSDLQFYDQSGNPITADVQITSLNLPTGASLTLNGQIVHADDTITQAQISAGELVFTPAAGANVDAADYAAFTFQATGLSSNNTYTSTMTVNIGHDDNWASSISADGQFVVFESNATNLPGDSNGHSNIYLYDTINHTITRVSEDDQTTDPTQFGDSGRAEISADGRYITYVSYATDLVAGGTGNSNGAAETYLYDRLTGETTLISSANGVTAANGDSEWGTTVSAGGIFDAFGSTATNIGGPSLVFTNAQAKASGSATTLSGLSISDVNAAANLTFTIQAADGSLSPVLVGQPPSLPAGLTIDTDNNGHLEDGSTGNLTVTGSLAAINAALQAGVIYTPSPNNASGSDTLTMTVSDPLGEVVSQSQITSPGVVQFPTAGAADILISDTSAGTEGLVLDDQVPSVLTTSGTMPFTDSGTHTVKAVALAGDWGTLTPVVSTDTTSSSLGEVSWTYQVNEALAATLAAGSTHQDTFTVQLTGAGGTASEVVTVTVVGTAESPTVAWGAAPTVPTVTVLTAQGFTLNQGVLNDLSADIVNSVQTSNTIDFVNKSAGYQFQLIGSDFSYNANGALNGGTVTGIYVLDLSNNQLLTETGFNISATDFVNAVNSHDTSLLDTIFNLSNPINSLVHSVQTPGTINFVNTSAGLQFQLIGSGFSYDTNGNLVGGNVTGIDVLDLSNDQLVTGTVIGTGIVSAAAFVNAVNSQDASLLNTIFNFSNPINEAGSTGPDVITGSNANGILIGGGGGDTLIAGTGNDILVSGPGGDGLPLTNHDITVTVTATPVVPAPTDPATPSGVVNTPIALTIDPSLIAAIESDASLSLTIYDIPTDTILSNSQGILTPVDGRITFSQAQLANGVLAGLAITAPVSEQITLSAVGTTNEGGVLIGGTIGSGADTFILGGHDGAETITNFSGVGGNGDVINLADVPVVSELGVVGSTNPSDLLHYATQVGSDTVIDFSGVDGLSTKVTLQDVNIGDLTAADFVFAQSVPADQISTIVTNSPIGTTFIESGAILLSNASNDLSFGSSPGAYGTLTQDLSGGTTALALNEAAYPYTVMSASDGTVTTFTSVANATFDVAAGTFTVTNGTGLGGANFGTLEVDSPATLTLNGTINSPGTINVTGNATTGGTLSLSGATLTAATLSFSGGNAQAIPGGVVLSGASIIDSVANDGSELTLTITASSGTLQAFSNQAFSNAGVTIVPGFDGTAGTLEVTGLLAAINAALANGLIYNPGGNGQNTLTFSVSGQSGAAFETLSIDTTQNSPVVEIVDASGLGGIISNAGVIDIANSTLTGGLGPITFINSGTINTSGADAIHDVSLTNTGILHVDAPGTLTIDAGTTITGGTVNIDNGDTLVLNDATLTGGSGTIAINNSGTIDVTGNSSINAANVIQTNTGQLTVDANQTLTLSNDTATNTGTIDNSGTLVLSAGSLDNSGTINVDGTATLHNESGPNTGTIEVMAGGALTLDQASDITGAGAITVDAAASPLAAGHLTLNTATLDGAVITDSGLVDLTGTDLIENGSLSVSGALNVSGSDTFTSEDVTNTGTVTVTAGKSLTTNAGSLDNSGTINVDGTATLHNESGPNTGTIEVMAGGALTLDQASDITGAGAITVDAAASPLAAGHLTLNTATLDGAVITDSGLVDLTGTDLIENGSLSVSGALNVSGSDTFTSEDVTNTGTVTVTAGKSLTTNAGSLDNSGTINVDGTATLHNESGPNTGTIEVMAGGALTLDQASDITGAGAITVDAAASPLAAGHLTLNTATLDGAVITDSGLVDLTGTDLIENGSLSVSGALNVSGSDTFTSEDVTNTGTVTVTAGKSLTTNAGSLDNSGTINVDGTATLHNESGPNTGTIEVMAGGALTLDQASDITGAGAITVDAAASPLAAGHLTLNTATLDGAVITDSGLVDLTGTDLIENGSLSVSGALNVSGSDTFTSEDVTNTGTVTVTAGKSLTTNAGSLDNSGTINVDGTATLHNESGPNTGTIEVMAGGALTLDQASDITGAGAITVDAAASPLAAGHLTLNTATLDGAVITDSGLVDLTGTDLIENGSLSVSGALNVSGSDTFTSEDVTNTGTVTVTAGKSLTTNAGSLDNSGTINVDGTATLHNESGPNTGTIEVMAGGALTLDQASDITGAGAITVDAAASPLAAGHLTLNTATLDGAVITDSGLVDLTGTDLIENGSLSVSGALNVSGSDTFTSEDVTNTGTVTVTAGKSLTTNAGSLDNSGTINVDGTATLHNESGPNTGTIEVMAGGALTLDQASDITGAGAITVDAAASPLAAGHLTLNTATLDGAVITDSGLVDLTGTDLIENGSLSVSGALNVSGSDTFTSEDVTNTGTVTVTAGKSLTTNAGSLDNSGTINVDGTATLHNESGPNTGTIEVMAGGALTLDQASDITGAGAITVDAAASPLAAGHLTLNTATLDGAVITDSGLVDLTGTDLIENGSLSVSGALNVSGSDTFTSEDVTNTGTVTAGKSLTTNAGSLDNSGTINVDGTATLHNESGPNTGTIEVMAGGALTLDQASDITGAGAITVDAAASPLAAGHLTLNTATLDGAVITDSGLVDLTGTDLIENGSLSVSGALNVSGSDTFTSEDVTNTGTVTVTAGKSLTTNAGSLDNSGTINVDGTATLHNESGPNTGTIEVMAGGALTLDQASDITGAGAITVDDGAQLTLSGTAISGGTINDGTAAGTIVGDNTVFGSIDVTGSSTIDGNASLNNGAVTVESGVMLTLDDVTVTGTTINGTDGTSIIQVDGANDTTGAPAQTLTLSGTTIDGGTINGTDATTGGIIASDIDVTGDSTIENASLNNGAVTVENGFTLTLSGDTVTGSTITDIKTPQSVDGTLILSGTTIDGGTINDGTQTSGGLIDVTGDSTIDGNASLNNGAVTVATGTTLTLDDVTVTGTTINGTDGTSIIQIDGNQTLTLSGTTIDGGTINGTDATTGGIIASDIDVTGDSTIENASLNNGAVTVENGFTLTLSGDTVTGSTITDIKTPQSVDGTLILSGTTIDGGTINDGTQTSGGLIDVTGDSTIDGNASLNNGAVTVATGTTLTLDDVTVTGSTITERSAAASGAAINIGSNKTLTLAGADTITGGQFAVGLGPVQAAGASVWWQVALITDLDPADNPTVTLTIQASSGSFAAISGSHLNVVQSGDEVTISGHLADINDALSGGLTYTPGAGVTTNTLTLSVTDGSDAGFRTISLDTSVPGSPTTSNIGASGEINNSGIIDVTETTTLDSDAVFNGASATVQVESGAHLTLDDSRTYGGTITDNGTVEVANYSVIVNGHVTGNLLTIDAGGTLNLNGATISVATVTNNGLIDVLGSSTINNGAQLSGGQLKIEAGQTLTLDGTTVTGSTINGTDAASTIQIDGNQTLTLSGTTIDGGTINGTDATTGGIIASDIDVTGDSTIENANLNNGEVTVESGATLTLNNDSLNGGTIDVLPGGSLELVGTIHNHGHIDIQGSSGAADLVISGSVTLDDSGTVTLDASDAQIDAVAAGGTLINVNNLISGSGTIGQGDGTPLTLINEAAGVIESTGNLVLQTGTRSGATTTSNAGTIEAVGIDRVLIIQDTNVDNSGGTIAAYNDINDPNVNSSNASHVDLNGVTITGGTLQTSYFGVIEDQSSSVFDGVTNQGVVDVDANTYLDLRHSLDNSNNIFLFGQAAQLEIDGAPFHLTGSGQILMESAQSSIVAIGPGVTLDNESNTISGNGTIGAGDGQLTLDNDGAGTIDANISGETLTLDTDNSITNAGLLEATQGGTLTIDDSVDNSGTIEAGDPSTVNIDGSVTNAIGGIIEATNGGDLTISGAVGNSGTITAGANSEVLLSNATIDGGTIADNGTIDVTGDSTVQGVVNGDVVTNAQLNNGGVTVESGATLTLDNVTVTGTVFNDTAVTYNSAPTTLVSFNDANGNYPYGGLIADAAGDLFGTTVRGGANGDGTVFEIVKTAAGYASTPTILASFDGTDGLTPDSPLLVDAAGDLFGTTQFGGANGDGTVFEIAKTVGGYAAPVTLASFDGANGVNPGEGLIADAAGDLFGTTQQGGPGGDGTVFELVNNGGGNYTPITLASFNGSNGTYANGALLADAAGDLFGTTAYGGTYNGGTVFELVNNGGGNYTPTTLVNFNVADGEGLSNTLIADAAGDLFGTTAYGGAYGGGSGEAEGDGTVFEIVKTVGGYASTPITLVSFDGADGQDLVGALFADAAGDLFGMTYLGGANNLGTVFEIVKTAGGYASTPITLFSFNGTDGAYATPGALIDVGGDLFGTAPEGDANGDGTVFEIAATGAVLSVDAGNTLTLDGVTINGGTITDNGLIDVTGNSNSTINGANLSGGAVTVENSASLTLDDVTVTNSAITDLMDVTQSFGTLILRDGTTISGGTITDNGLIDVTGNSTINDGASLSGVTTDSNQFISGSVTVESGVTLTLDDATVTGTTITNTDGTSVIQIDGNQTLTLSGATIDGGTINGTAASGSVVASDIDVTGSSSISGSASANVSIAGGQLTVESGMTLILDDVTINNVAISLGSNDTIEVDSGQMLTIASGNSFSSSGTVTWDNNGHIIISGVNTTTVTSVIYEGSGTRTLAGGALQAGSTIVTTTNEGNTFDGYGQLGGGTATSTFINNAGAFDADVSGQTYAFDTGDGVTNAGTFEATNGGTLLIESTVMGDRTVINDTGGTGNVQAGAGSEVELSYATINGGTGTVSTAAAVGQLAGGLILGVGASKIENATINNAGTLETGGTFTLDNDTINGGVLTGTGTNSTYSLDSGDTLTLNGVTFNGGANSGGTGVFTNAGIITLENSLTVTGSSFTLEFSGAGTVALNGATVEASAPDLTFENNGNMISGAGQIGNGNSDLTLDNNAGTIKAVDGTLTIDTDNIITNAAGAILEAASGANLLIDDSTVANAGNIQDDGTLLLGASSLTLTGNGTLSISGGMLRGYGSISNLTLNNDGNTISGTGQIGIGGIILNNYSGVIEAVGGTLTVDAGTITNDGTMAAENGATLIVESATPHTLFNNGTILANGGTVNVTDAVTGGGSATIKSGGTLELGSTDAQTVNFSGVGTLKLDSTSNFTGNFTGLALGDTIDYAGNASITGAVIDGSTLTVTESGSTQLTYQISGNIAGDHFAVERDGNGGTDLVLTPDLWGTFAYPSAVTAGVHLFAPILWSNASPVLGAMLFGETTDYQTSGTNAVTESLLTIDPFLLPFGSNTPVPLPSSPFSLEVPVKYSVMVPANTPNEVIVTYVTEGTTDTINQIFITGGSTGLNNPLTGGTPTAIESNLSGTIENLFVNPWTPNSELSAYDVAWDQYDSVDQTYQAYFQIFNASGTALQSPVTIFNLTEVTALTSAPAWAIGGSAPLSSDGVSVPFLLASAQSNGAVQFQGYYSDGTEAASVNWSIVPDLLAYEAGATSQITQEVSATTGAVGGTALTFTQIGGGRYATAWNDTVTDGNGTHDQVEFAIFAPNTLSASDAVMPGTTVSQSTFQIADGNAQNIRVGSFSFGGSAFEYLAYGDSTATHIVEFDSSGNEIASFIDPTTVQFSTVQNFQDGLIGIAYDEPDGSNETTQYVMNIYDLRSSGLNINDSTGTYTSDQYIAGTQYTDTVTGANNVNNVYYFVGDNTTSGSGPTDSFTGGSNGWNIAIFSDARSDYMISTQVENNGPNITTIASNGDDPAHTGSLEVANVEFLAFGPAVDPVPVDNIIDVSAGTFVILGGNSAITIEAGATAELDSAASGSSTYSGSVTFEANSGTLTIDPQPGVTPTTLVNLTGQINGLAVGDIIDLANTTVTSASITGSTLTVTESNGSTLTYQVAGALTGNSFAIQSDDNGGDELVLEPTVLTVGVSTTDNNTAIQVGQLLVAQATLNTDNATVNYQWQISSDSGASWTNVAATTTGDYGTSGTLASFLQLSAADEGDLVRAVASFTNAGQLITATAAAATAVTDVTPEITAPFRYAVDDLSISKVVSGTVTQIYNDTFTAPPPTSPASNGTPVEFATQGSIWSEGTGRSGQAAAILSSTGVAPSGAGTAVSAFLNTNTSPTSTSGLKLGGTFTVGAIFDLPTGVVHGNYGLQLNDGTSGQVSDQIVSLVVANTGSGGVQIELLQQNNSSSTANTSEPANTTTVLASQTLTSAQLASDDQIAFSLAHTAGSTAITGSFQLLDNGVVDTTNANSSTTFTPTGTIFTGSVDWTRADIFASITPGPSINIAAGSSPHDGQTLTASATTNDPDASVINYQWEESATSSFTSFTDIGANSPSYTVQGSDIGDFIRVVATTNDSGNPGTATSSVTGAVLPAPPSLTVPGAQTLVVDQATAVSGVSLAETGATSGETFTVTLTDTNGDLSATGSGVSGSGTTSLTITGSLSQVNGDLAMLSDMDGTAGSNTITLHATDSFGDSAAQQTIAVTADPATPILNTLASFDGVDGANPQAGLFSNAAGDLFGTTINGGTSNDGTVFEIANTGAVNSPVYGAPTPLVSFNGSDGYYPTGGLISNAAGDLFGTTDEPSGYGTVFEIVNTGSVNIPVYGAPTTLVSFASFSGADGTSPQATLIANAAGDLFETTFQGGQYNDGTVLELANIGTVSIPHYSSTPTVLVSFDGTDGQFPVGALISDAAGDLFGTTVLGGQYGDGAVFEVANTGSVASPIYSSTPTTLVSFDGGNGLNPTDTLISDAAGDLFGTTQSGGAHGDGTVFEISNGTLTTLANFNGTGNGANPSAGLIIDAAGDLFGTTGAGGAGGDGTVFEIANTGSVNNPVYGALTTLVSFNGTDGALPVTGLISNAAGDLFGTTDGSPSSDGTVFEVTGTGFVVADPSATAVTINAGATFEINSASTQTVTFAGAAGTLVLDHAATFTGEIAGISGTGDVLDFKGFDWSDTSATTGTGSYNSATNTTALTVTDSSDNQSVELTLAGNYSGSTWTVTTDNNGGANIVDPPATGSAAANTAGSAGTTVVSSMPNQTMTGSGSNDTFVFAPGFGNATITNFQPTTDVIQMDHSVFANVQAILAAAQDDGHGNVVITADAQDTIVVQHVTLAQLQAHQSDFHIV